MQTCFSEEENLQPIRETYILKKNNVSIGEEKYVDKIFS